ncbi:LapA family protein [Williamsia herbipolensis]|uniref:LapA family protein n=1 Tax=Williamsia herbipolensis TaxID=1603258 RepID=A0AAU4K0B7_9NOCA|nr:LapA family protein [Williamsia herbipolensis]
MTATTTRTPSTTTERPARRGFGAASKMLLAVATVLVAALVVFVLQNTVHTTISFVAWDFDLGVGVALLGSAVVGAVVALTVSGAIRARRALR